MKKREETRLINHYRQRYQRKAATRLLNQVEKDHYGCAGPGPKRRYDPAVFAEPLQHIWLATDQVCSKKLKAAFRVMVGTESMQFSGTNKAKMYAQSTGIGRYQG